MAMNLWGISGSNPAVAALAGDGLACLLSRRAGPAHSAGSADNQAESAISPLPVALEARGGHTDQRRWDFFRARFFAADFLDGAFFATTFFAVLLTGSLAGDLRADCLAVR